MADITQKIQSILEPNGAADGCFNLPQEPLFSAAPFRWMPIIAIPCQNWGGVVIYRPFGGFRRANSYCHLYGAQGVLLPPFQDQFRGPRSDYVRQVVLATTSKIVSGQYYEDGQEEPDSARADKIYAGIQLSNKSEKYFLKINKNSLKGV
ncbi:hypothetical protein TNCV_2878841 [Trichonephila clavipes]|uniref:Uncharacterized protein n=1 Tax=Trichonephila clavipes TaxID=2585209 RepID=A0A8X7BDE6_TRICX|nr:hypothetical protein TNCV_2878841 [Trichonephila clavipes]